MESADGSMQGCDMATENDTTRLVNFDEVEGLSVEDEMLLSDILQIFRSGEKIDCNFKGCTGKGSKSKSPIA